MLMSISNKHQVSHFFAGEVIYKEGQSGGVAYYIVNGSVELSIARGNTNIVIGTITSGAYFGEQSLLLGTNRHATATTTCYTEVLVVSMREFGGFMDETPPIIKEMLVEVAQRLDDSLRWVEQCELNTNPFMSGAEMLELHARAGMNPDIRVNGHVDTHVVLDYHAIAASIARVCGLFAAQVDDLLQCMEDLELFHSVGEHKSKQLFVNAQDLVERARRLSKHLTYPEKDALRAEVQSLDMTQMVDLVDTDREQILGKVVEGELPDSVLLFNKPAVLALLKLEGKDAFKKRQAKPIEQWAGVADLCFANNHILQDIVSKQEPYILAALLRMLDESTATRMVAMMSARRRKILQNMSEQLGLQDPTELEAIAESVIEDVKHDHVTELSISHTSHVDDPNKQE